jgi:hypothetical protein
MRFGSHIRRLRYADLVHPKGETDRKIAAPEINRKDGSHPMRWATTESELTESDALIVKAYAMFAPAMRLVVPSGDGFKVTDESRTR